jgi:uncharacterized membrane protein (UPF0136 family)
VPSYETLDAIADAYNPALAIITLLLIATRMFRAQWRAAGLGMVAFAVVAGISFGLMFVDRWLKIWPAFGLDYSTHTATSLGLVMLLSYESRKLMPLWLVSFLCYLLLMLYQRYHSVADMVTTAVVVGLPMGLGMAALYRWQRRISATSTTDAQLP